MRVRAGILSAALAAGIVAVPLAGAEQSQSQRFFREQLLEDGRTSERIKDVLRSGGFVERNVTFKDLTEDEREDAVVRVNSGGAAGVVAVYVFSTAGGGDELAAIFRSQRLARASTRVRKGRLSYRYARYAPGDELCCPSRIDETRTRWAPKKKRIVVRDRRTVFPEPTPTPTPTP